MTTRRTEKAQTRISVLSSLLAGKNLVVLVGEGGVGKTSASAAIAYGLACRASRVGVLTVDPAPRLGDALGISAIDATPREIALPAHAKGSLVAMCLDSKRTFDRMVERYAPSRSTAAALLAHPIYTAVSEQLGGGEHFAAFQRLHELMEEGEYETLVIDTPPAANARDLLSAPSRLADLLDTSALSMLTDPARIVARAGGAFARATLSLVLSALERATGSSLQHDVAEFMTLFGELVGGLEGRARDIDALLRADTTAFVLVTRPREADVASALAFHRELSAMGIRTTAVIVNRVTNEAADRRVPAAERLASCSREQRVAILRMEADMDALREGEAIAVAALRTGLEGAKAPPIIALPTRDLDIASLDDVAELAVALDC